MPRPEEAGPPFTARVRAALDTGVSAGGTKLTTATLDPWLYAVGLRYDF